MTPQEPELNTEKAFPSIFYKEKLKDFLIQLQYYKARASAVWGGEDTKNFIIFLRLLFSLLQDELIINAEKIKDAKLKEERIKYIKQMDEMLNYSEIDPINLTSNKIRLLMDYSREVTKILYIMGITNLKVEEADRNIIKNFKGRFS